jgi:hypothetical protein
MALSPIIPILLVFWLRHNFSLCADIIAFTQT